LDPQILDAVLEGLRFQKQQLDRYITEAQRLLGGRGRKPAAAVKEAKEPRRKMSAASRKRIAVAQKKRWAEYRNRKATAVQEAKEPRRKMSAASRKRVAAAARKRWAE
jgi:hypothetical protein